jgi:spermidine synthase
MNRLCERSSSTPATAADARRPWVGSLVLVSLVYFLSGMCSLIDQVIWVRLLKLILGNTVQASTLVVSVFLGGLALGSFIAARYADRLRSPLKVYAGVELAVAVSVLLTPLVLGGADAMYRWFYRACHPSQAGVLAVQAMVSAAVLLVPTTLMGGTLPILGGLLAGRDRFVGRTVGVLYAVNTLGAATGCFLAGFVLIRGLGVMGTLYLAAAANLLVVPCAWAIAGSRRADAAGATPAAEESPAPGKATVAAGEAGRRCALLAVCATVGFLSIAYEIAWIRGIIVFTGSTTYVFSSVLTVYLAGTVMGAAAAGRLSAAKACRPDLALGAALCAMGIAGLSLAPVLYAWPSLHERLIGPAAALAEQYLGAPQRMSQPLLTAAAFFLPPAVILGFGFPLAVAAWRAEPRRAGRPVGLVFGAGTAGSVAGGLITGFCLLPALGLQRTMTVLGLAGAVAGCAFLLARTRFRAAALAGGFLAAAVGIALATPADLFHRALARKLRIACDAEKVLHIEEGLTATVSVHVEEGGTRHLSVSGVHVASDEPAQSAWQTFHGHSGMLMRSDAASALCIGYGTGESVACLRMHSLKVVDCVEISPEVVRASIRFFPHLNTVSPSYAPAARILIADGKNYLRLTDAAYDLILNDPINPLYGDNASLYAREYFESVRDRLNPGGLFLCWLPVELPTEVFDSVLATAVAAFPRVTLWSVPGGMGNEFVQLACSRDAQRLDAEQVERQLAGAAGQDLFAIGMDSAERFLWLYRCDEKDIRAYLTNAVVNSDLHPFVEFCSRPIPTALQQAPVVERLLRSVRAGSLTDHLERRPSPEEKRPAAGQTPEEK